MPLPDPFEIWKEAKKKAGVNSPFASSRSSSRSGRDPISPEEWRKCETESYPSKPLNVPPRIEPEWVNVAHEESGLAFRIRLYEAIKDIPEWGPEGPTFEFGPLFGEGSYFVVLWSEKLNFDDLKLIAGKFTVPSSALYGPKPEYVRETPSGYHVLAEKCRWPYLEAVLHVSPFFASVEDQKNFWKMITYARMAETVIASEAGLI